MAWPRAAATPSGNSVAPASVGPDGPQFAGDWSGLFNQLAQISHSQIGPSIARSRQTWIAAGVLALGSLFTAVLFHKNVTPTRALAPQPPAVQQPLQSSMVVKGQQNVPFTNRWGFGTAKTETVVATDASGDDIDPNIPDEDSSVRRPVRTVRFDRLSGQGEMQAAPVPAARTRPMILDTEVQAELPGSGRADDVVDYLWEVYLRQPVKKDGSGDFTWKDPAAAKRLGMSLKDYVISGMDPDFREQLYHAGHAMDAAGLEWSMLSAFRDDYRQSLASGFKARVGNSLHGGSRRTGGYGHGRAIDITLATNSEEAETVWHWIDAHGGQYGLSRPMPGYDPAHIQSGKGDWHKVAANLRQSRIRTAQANAAAARKIATAAAAQ
jgi:hypothetical protein